jgi:hypothetical protein
MATYAVIHDGVVVNTIEWDGSSDWTEPAGMTTQPVPDGAYVGIGSTFENGVFSAPPQPPSVVI